MTPLPPILYAANKLKKTIQNKFTMPNPSLGHSDPVHLLILNLVYLIQDELSACLMVTGEELMETLGQLVSCVGCRYTFLTILITVI